MISGNDLGMTSGIAMSSFVIEAQRGMSKRNVKEIGERGANGALG
jgi:hypothetical protein